MIQIIMVDVKTLGTWLMQSNEHTGTGSVIQTVINDLDQLHLIYIVGCIPL